MKIQIPAKVKTIAVTCLQWGDTGKGKIVDLLGTWADIIVRGTGGANAGHTVCLNGADHIFHLIPSAILHDCDGKVNVVGGGTAIDPRIFCEELAVLEKQGLSCEHLKLALNAKLTLPTQIVRDRVGEGSASEGKIGTTGRGIGPTYGDHVIRVGLQVNDLLNADILMRKIRENVAFSRRILKSYDPELVKEILHQPYLGKGIFYHPGAMFDVDAIMQKYLGYGDVLRHFICDTDTFVQKNVGKKRLLLEGAQGTMLDVDYGTLPFVTSSGCTVDNLAKGAGLNRSHVDWALGVVKFPYMTRVGEGPFPTELGGKASAEWCRTATRETEQAKYPDVTVNDMLEFHQGIAIRIAGNEFGATTKRPRRTGWLDLPLLRHALRWGSLDVVLTKLDVLDQCEVINICEAYEYTGNTYHFGERTLSNGDRLSTAIPCAEVLEHCMPVYREFPGWKTSLKGITHFEDLPGSLKAILGFVIHETGINPRIISVGPDRGETIFV